jgi:hypothetical protein
MQKSTSTSTGARVRASSVDNVNQTSAESYIMRSKKAAGYLRQILHSQSCTGRCESSACVQTRIILEHVPVCQREICSVPGCDTTKKLLLHFQQCATKEASRAKPTVCLICAFACSSSPMKQQSGHAYQNKPRSHTIDETKVAFVEESEEDTTFCCEELIECNRIPFQRVQPPAAGRVKTYSDFN